MEVDSSANGSRIFLGGPVPGTDTCPSPGLKHSNPKHRLQHYVIKQDGKDSTTKEIEEQGWRAID